MHVAWMFMHLGSCFSVFTDEALRSFPVKISCETMDPLSFDRNP